jgi:hypothetical protein
MGENSAVRLISPSLLNTQVQLDRGRADVEVDEIKSRNDLQITVAGASTRLLKDGLYAFDADKNSVRVFKGEAELQERADNQKPIKVKGDREVQLAATETIQPASFNRNQAKDPLYQWSSLRSQYLAEANMNLASAYAGYGGVGPGWYWDAGFWGYTWLPGDGLLWNPFGWGFYSPRYIYYGGPVFYGNHGYGYRGYSGRGYAQFHGAGGSFHGEGVGGGFHGGGGGFHGGGSHGGRG